MLHKIIDWSLEMISEKKWKLEDYYKKKKCVVSVEDTKNEW